jgi:hypothetical protein
MTIICVPVIKRVCEPEGCVAKKYLLGHEVSAIEEDAEYELQGGGVIQGKDVYGKP